MKFLHTSDLHLGLRLCEMSMNGDMAHLLEEIADIAEEEDCRAVIVAGDLYDRSNPAPEAVTLFDRFVTDLAGRGIPVLAVAGNHDSAERVAYLSAVLEKSGVYLSPVFDGTTAVYETEDESGKVRFYLMPYLRPALVRNACEDFDGSGWEEALRHVIDGMNPDPTLRNVLVAHQYVAGESGEIGETVGNLEAVPPSLFAPFHYTALGHLHRAHSVGEETIRYSGSPLKCSFAEADDEKSVCIVELDAKGDVTLHSRPLHPLHDLREMRGTYEEVISLEFRQRGREDDYLHIILTDEEDVVDAVPKLRTVYPNLMRLSYDNIRTRAAWNRSAEQSDDGEDEGIRPVDVFRELYERQNGAAPEEELMALVAELFEKIEETEGTL